MEVAIPAELGEGIELPESGITVELEEAPVEMAPSTIDESVAFYPNVAEETDLAVTPTPTGVETLSQVRTAEAPRSETFHLSLPAGGRLKADEAGGVEAVSASGEGLLEVPAPVAIDASGREVPSSLEFSGDLITVSISPDGSTSWPALVDPSFLAQSYAGATCSWERCDGRSHHEEEGWEPEVLSLGGNLISGLSYDTGFIGEDISIGPDGGNPRIGDHANWTWRVPRYQEEPRPTTYISRAVLSNLTWQTPWGQRASPFLYAGIRSPVNWVSFFSQRAGEGYGLPAHTYEFPNPEPNSGVKELTVGLYAQEDLAASENVGSVHVEGALVEMGEPAGVVPAFGSVTGPGGWMDTTPEPIEFVASDSGLGMYAMHVDDKTGSSPPSWTTRALDYPDGVATPCTGLADSACPRTWKSKYSPVEYRPSALPTGVDKLELVAEDPLGRTSAPSTVEVKVDHTPPTLALSGTLTEQADLGTSRPTYTLDLDATDGTAEAPQSGVAKADIKVDGEVVAKFDPGCSSRNCPLSREWTLESADYTDGPHTVEVTATDGVGVTTTKTLSIELAPELKIGLSGTLKNQMGTFRPSYGLQVDADGEAAGGESSSRISVQIEVDGEIVEAGGAPCTAEGCSVSSEWTLESSRYSAGQHRITVEVTDAAGDVGRRSWTVEIDHDTTPPEISLSSTITEQATLGTGLPSYQLDVHATDGSAAAPQSGVAKTVVKVDGGVLDEQKRECPVQNCVIIRELILHSREYSDGPHTVEVTATDEAGLSTTKILSIELSSAPTIRLSGTMAEERKLGDERPRYGLHAEATADAGGSPPELESFQVHLWNSTDGNEAAPTAIATDPEGDIWVTDSAVYPNGQVAEYGEVGEPWAAEYPWLEIGEACPGGQSLDGPQGIAIDPEGDVWVADTGENRVIEFGRFGECLLSFGSQFGFPGSGEGQLSEPTGLAIDPEGNVWVADTGNARIEEFDQEGAYIAQFNLGLPVRTLALDGEGGFWAGYLEGAAEGYLLDWGAKGEPKRLIGGLRSEPTAIATDPDGDVWVTDPSSGRIAEYEGEVGELQFPVVEEPILEFGGPGSEEGPLDEPRGIAIDSEGNLWVADTGDERVEEWASEPVQSMAVDVEVDGKTVESAETPCNGESCSAATDWTLDASEYPAKWHHVSITATESPGRTTTKGLEVELKPDTTGPKIEAGGELGDAPMGWVEQRSYGLHVVATDGGTGVSSLVFKIDGNAVASVPGQECGEGGCEEALSEQIDMSSYSGGAHEAEIVATDEAGNSTTKKWTINVDPEGHIGTAEAEDTLEALDETSESTAVASNEELLAPEQMEGGDNPTFEREGDEITSSGVPDQTSLSTNVEEGITIESPEGETVIVPLVGEGSSDASVAGEVAAVSSNTASEVDSVIRPEYNGLQYFEEIRSSESPETFSWRVRMSEDQSLKLVNPQQAEVIYEDGTESFLITAEHAKDATGAEVPTSLEVNGNVLTLKIAHRSGSYVYPIVAANYWETSYVVPIEVEKPEDEMEIREREEREQRELEEREREEREAEENGGSPPPPPPPSQVTERMARRYAEFGPERDPDVAPSPLPPPGAATASAVRYYQIYRSSCGHFCDWWKAKLYNATFIRHTESAEWEHGTQVHAHVDQSLLFEAVIFDTTWNCGAVGPDFVRKGSGEHLIAYAHFTIEVPWAAPSGETMAPFENNFALQDWIYPNGYQEKHVKPWDGEPNGNGGCPTVARP